MDIRELTDQVEHISQAYASRFEVTRDDNWQILKLQEEVGELTQAHLMRQGQARTKGLSPGAIDTAFREEIADALSRTRREIGFVHAFWSSCARRRSAWFNVWHGRKVGRGFRIYA